VDCINTGGEKVHAPEVVDVLTSHPGVLDACVFGVPHPRLGNTVAAIVALRPGARLPEVLAHASDRLAKFKAPTVAVQAPVPRTPAGKVDLAAAHALIAGHSSEGA
jgi:acyl-CoA synthetase (AMP-forming)/AMP-acid ligase II